MYFEPIEIPTPLCYVTQSISGSLNETEDNGCCALTDSQADEDENMQEQRSIRVRRSTDNMSKPL